MVEQSLQRTTATRAAGCPVLVLDETGHIVASNAMAQNMLGLSAEELVARYCHPSLVPNDQSNGVADSLAVNVGSPLAVLTLGTENGEDTLVKGTCVTVDAATAGRLLTLVILDQSRAPAPGIVNLSGRCLADAAHEVRTPLCSLVGYLDLLGDTYRTVRRGELARIVGVLRRSTRWLERSIDNLLSAVEICSGRFGITPAPIRLAELLADAVDVVAIVAAGKRQRLELVLPEAQAVVWADREHLLQVLATLLSNAIKHAPVDGRVAVATAETGGQWQISISDHSSGTPWWEQGYAGGDSCPATKLPGSENRIHLGIAIAKHVIELHGGTMGLTSSPEKGNTVWFTLPSAPAGMDGAPSNGVGASAASE